MGVTGGLYCETVVGIGDYLCRVTINYHHHYNRQLLMNHTYNDNKHDMSAGIPRQSQGGAPRVITIPSQMTVYYYARSGMHNTSACAASDRKSIHIAGSTLVRRTLRSPRRPGRGSRCSRRDARSGRGRSGLVGADRGCGSGRGARGALGGGRVRCWCRWRCSRGSGI